jgi:hypothetical protein
VCIASGDARTLITAEPAVVIPLDSDLGNPEEDESVSVNSNEESLMESGKVQEGTTAAQMPLTHQPGKIFRRIAPHSPVTSPVASGKAAIASARALATSSNQPGRMMRRASLASRMPRIAPQSPITSPTASGKRTVGSTVREDPASKQPRR